MTTIVNEPEIMTVLVDTEALIIFGKQDGSLYQIQKHYPIQAPNDTLKYSHTQSSLNQIGAWPDKLPYHEEINLYQVKSQNVVVGFLQHTMQWVISKLTK